MSSRGSEKVCLFRCVGCGAAFTDFHDGEDHFALRGPDHKYEAADFLPASLLSEIADTLDARAKASTERGESVIKANALREAAQLVRDHLSIPGFDAADVANRESYEDIEPPFHSTPEEGK